MPKTHAKVNQDLVEVCFSLEVAQLPDYELNQFLSDLLKIGTNLNSSKTSYDEAMNKLTSGNGNILKKIENLKKLGAKTKKQLPQNIIDRANSDEDN